MGEPAFCASHFTDATWGKRLRKIHNRSAVLRSLEASFGIKFDGKQLRDLSHKKMIDVRRDLQIVFQEPFSSLIPGRCAICWEGAATFDLA